MTYAWLAISVWWVLIPIMLFPAAWSMATFDFSILSEFAWRALLLLAVVRVVTDRLLRVREHEADLTAALPSGGRARIRALASSSRAGDVSGWRRAIARHPAPALRAAVLDDPARLARPTYLDGLATAFLAAVAMPLVVGAVGPALTGTGAADLTRLVAALAVGPLLGASIGVGLWRASVVSRISSPVGRPWQVSVGVGTGIVLGDLASLEHTGTLSVSGTPDLGRLALLAVAAVGATALVAGVGEVWADAAPAARRPPWAFAMILGATVFTTLLWSQAKLGTSLDHGWDNMRRETQLLLGSWPLAAVGALLALFALVGVIGSQPAGPAPAWLVEEGDRFWFARPVLNARRVLLLGLTSGAVGVAVMLGYRAFQGAPVPGVEAGNRFDLYVWLAAVVGAAAMLALSVGVPYSGAGIALAASPVASLTVMVGFLVLNTALGGQPTAGLVAEFARPALALGLLLGIPVAAAALLPITAQGLRFHALTVVVAAASLTLGFVAVLPRPSDVPPADAYLTGVAAPLLAMQLRSMPPCSS